MNSAKRHYNGNKFKLFLCLFFNWLLSTELQFPIYSFFNFTFFFYFKLIGFFFLSFLRFLGFTLTVYFYDLLRVWYSWSVTCTSKSKNVHQLINNLHNLPQSYIYLYTLFSYLFYFVKYRFIFLVFKSP